MSGTLRGHKLYEKITTGMVQFTGTPMASFRRPLLEELRVFCNTHEFPEPHSIRAMHGTPMADFLAGGLCCVPALGDDPSKKFENRCIFIWAVEQIARDKLDHPVVSTIGANEAVDSVVEVPPPEPPQPEEEKRGPKPARVLRTAGAKPV